MALKGLYNPNWVVFVTTLRARGTTGIVLMPLYFLAHSIRLWLGLGYYDIRKKCLHPRSLLR